MRINIVERHKCCLDKGTVNTRDRKAKVVKIRRAGYERERTKLRKRVTRIEGLRES